MIIPQDFDLSNRDRRDLIFKQSLQTAEKMNARIKHFFKNIDDNPSLSQTRKNEIKSKTLKDVQR